MDKLYYKPGWIPVSKDEWQEIIKNLISREQWIIDENYSSTLDKRLSVADIVIFFSFSKLLCLYRTIIRSLNKDQPFDKVRGDRNKLSWDLIKKIIQYPRKEVLEKLNNHKNTKRIYVVRNDKETESLIKKLINLAG